MLCPEASARGFLKLQEMKFNEARFSTDCHSSRSGSEKLAQAPSQ